MELSGKHVVHAAFAFILALAAACALSIGATQAHAATPADDIHAVSSTNFASMPAGTTTMAKPNFYFAGTSPQEVWADTSDSKSRWQHKTASDTWETVTTETFVKDETYRYVVLMRVKDGYVFYGGTAMEVNGDYWDEIEPTTGTTYVFASPEFKATDAPNPLELHGVVDSEGKATWFPVALDTQDYRIKVVPEIPGFETSTSNDCSFQARSRLFEIGAKAGTYEVFVCAIGPDDAKQVDWTSFGTFELPKETFHRLYGEEALDTMAAIVYEGWGTTSGETVVLTTDAGYWDALTAAGVAGMAGAPVLMTNSEELSPQTKAVLADLAPTTIVICGGENAIDPIVEVQAKLAAGTSPKVYRLWGETMTDTADAIYKGTVDIAGGAWQSTALICTSNGYWDALAAAPICYRKHMPIFLTESLDNLSSATLATMMKGKIDSVYIVGGELVVSKEVEAQLKSVGINILGRLAGETAIDTSVKVADFGVTALGMSPNLMGVATQNGYWDALAGAALCGRLNSVLVLVDKEDSASISQFVKIKAAAIDDGFTFGGKFAINEATKSALETAAQG